jgi:hypothetical protein
MHDPCAWVIIALNVPAKETDVFAILLSGERIWGELCGAAHTGGCDAD